MITVAYNRVLEHLFTAIELGNPQVIDLHTELMTERRRQQLADARRVQYNCGSERLNFLFKSEAVYVGLMCACSPVYYSYLSVSDRY